MGVKEIYQPLKMAVFYHFLPKIGVKVFIILF